MMGSAASSPLSRPAAGSSSPNTSNASDNAAAAAPACPFVPFAVTRYGEIGYSPATTQLLADHGGPAAIVAITTAFYRKFHEDVHLKQFLGGLQQPLEVHAHRLGSYIAEMMGAPGKPWTRDTRTRDPVPIRLGNGETRPTIVRDRATAHHCAWNSVDRPKEKMGRRFKLDDCRVWMRLMFWAARDCGFSESHPLFQYLLKFVAHFISIYEQTARRFTLLESRWSLDPANTDAYLANGRFMIDVVDLPFGEAVKALPRSERDGIDEWLYGNAQIVADDM